MLACKQQVENMLSSKEKLFQSLEQQLVKQGILAAAIAKHSVTLLCLCSRCRLRSSKTKRDAAAKQVESQSQIDACKLGKVFSSQQASTCDTCLLSHTR